MYSDFLNRFQPNFQVGNECSCVKCHSYVAIVSMMLFFRHHCHHYDHQQPPTIPTNETLLVQAEQSNTSSVRHSTQIVYPLSAIVHDVLWLFSRAMMNLDGDTINNYLSCGKCYERKWHPNGRLGRLGCRKDVRNVILNDIRYSF